MTGRLDLTMAMSYLEKLATKDTGRLALASRKSARGRLVVYPATIGFPDLIRLRENDESFRNYYVTFDSSGGLVGRRLRTEMMFLARLIRLAPICHEMQLYCVDERADRNYVMFAAVIARVIGLPVMFHDYGFRRPGESRRVLSRPALFRRIEYGDTTAEEPNDGRIPSVSFRFDPIEISCYRKWVKQRAVPRVIVYGDFGDPKTISLVTRTYEMVKRKYPRTEFYLVSLTDFNRRGVEDIDGSINFYSPRSEDELQGLFSAADGVMLLSPGGVNRLFVSRARAAGYPVIVNGLDYSETDHDKGRNIAASRGSYSGLAEALISLVDDETYYRGFRDF
jgi:hypothetical protein